MGKIGNFTILILLLFGLGVTGKNVHAQSSVVSTIVIDAGHGGKDPGCHGKNSREKEMTLALALEFGQLLKEKYPDVHVVYTRTEDVFVPLDKRADIANKNQADLFISLHCNAHSSQVTGTETFVMGLHKAQENLELAKRENASIFYEKDYQTKYQGFDPNSDEGHIWLTMVQNAYLAQSINLADKIEHEFQKIAGRKSRGVKQAGFVVLRMTTMPSVLIEAGFLSNAEEELFLMSENGRHKMAFALFRAFESYRKEMDRLAGPVSKAESVHLKSPSLVQKAPEPEIWIDKPIFREDTGEPDVVYKVQLKSALTPVTINYEPWTRVELLEEVWEKNRYKYLAGGFRDLDSAIKGQSFWRANGFPDAFVVAYRNGERVSMAKLRKP